MHSNLESYDHKNRAKNFRRHNPGDFYETQETFYAGAQMATTKFTKAKAARQLAPRLSKKDPFPTHDMHNYVRLSRHLSIPLLATEITPGGLAALPPWITSGATDFLRGDVVIKGGITGLMKIARLAEAFGMNCEVHDFLVGKSPMNHYRVGRHHPGRVLATAPS